MKKLLIGCILASFLTVMFGCASSRGVGCPGNPTSTYKFRR